MRKSFDQLGVGDQRDHGLRGLCSDAEFGRADRWLAIRGADGRKLTSAVEMMLSQLDLSRRIRSG